MIELATPPALELPMHRLLAALTASFLSAFACADDYVVRISEDLRTFDVRACFERPPTTLRAGDDLAARYLIDARWEGAKKQHKARRDRLELTPTAAPACLNYRVDTGAAAEARALRRSAFAGRDLIITPELWLWRAPGELTVRFELPPDTSASLPWPRVRHSEHRWHYRVTDAPRTWAAQAAFGRLLLETVTLVGGRLEVAIADAASIESVANVLQWLRTTAGAMTTVYGRFPLERAQVLIIPGDHSSPVPWGQVLRGGAPAVHFYIDRHADLDTLLQDWTAFHEFSHLFLPFVRRYEAYLSEGFASYFQNLTRARSGNLSEREAWSNLWRGFERGRDAGGGDTLATAARWMGRDRNYMRVYWSGAAIALKADVALRQTDKNREGLGALLGQLNRCCRTDNEAWSGARLCAALDELSGDTTFTDLNNTLADSREFPDIFPLLRQLGVALVNGDIVLDESAPLSEVRRAITRRTQSNLSGRAASQ